MVKFEVHSNEKLDSQPAANRSGIILIIFVI